jgi:hypothetical protein
MSTRSLTILCDDADLNGHNTEIVVMYRHADGYPEGHGKELKEFLLQFEAVTNGIVRSSTGRSANGGSCLAAQIVSHFKGNRVGDIYLYPAGTRDLGVDYRYTVIPQVGGPIRLKVESMHYQNEGQWTPVVIYDGIVEFFDPKAATALDQALSEAGAQS